MKEVKVLILSKTVSKAKVKLDELTNLRCSSYIAESNTMKKILTREGVEFEARAFNDFCRGLESDLLYLDTNILCEFSHKDFEKIAYPIVKNSFIDVISPDLDKIIWFN